MSAPVQAVNVCRECGKALERKETKRGGPRMFCDAPCRLAFNNRRRDRGAELYDLFMALRFEREKAAKSKVWSLLCDRASAYRDADKARRDGRKSWQSLRAAMEALPLGRTQNAGDMR